MAFNADDQVIAASDIVSATPKPVKLLGGLEVTPDAGGTRLSWTPYGGPEWCFDFYKIVYSLTDETPSYLDGDPYLAALSDQGASTFVSPDLVSGKTYFIRVQALRGTELGGFVVAQTEVATYTVPEGVPPLPFCPGQNKHEREVPGATFLPQDSAASIKATSESVECSHKSPDSAAPSHLLCSPQSALGRSSQEASLMPADPAPITNTNPSRRALLAGMLGGIGAWAAATLGRAAPASAAVGDNLKAGSVITAAGQSSGVTNNSSSNPTWVVTQNGTGTAVRAVANAGTASRFTTTAAGKYAVVATNSATSPGIGAAIQANGNVNVGLQAGSDESDAIVAVGFYSGINAEGTGFAGNGVVATCLAAGQSWGVSAIGQAQGVHAIANRATGENYGVYAYTNSTTNGWAGYFENDVFIGGSVVAPAWVGQVDDPASPTTRWLQHAVVESSERVRTNSGTATLDSRGEATVQVPSRYPSLHTDHRYQLTAIGSPGPRLHVSRELDKSGTFAIGGGAAGQRVSWQLTGVRADPFARAHPLVTEQPKPSWRQGTYTHPELYGASADLGPRAVAAKPAR